VALDAAYCSPLLHEQHSELACSVTSVSGIVLTVSPWLTSAPWDHPLTIPCPGVGRPDPVELAAREHEQAAACSARVFCLT
jgi:hypothetical protein